MRGCSCRWWWWWWWWWWWLGDALPVAGGVGAPKRLSAFLIPRAPPDPTSRPDDTKSEFSVKFEISGPRAHERCNGPRIWGCGATTVCNGVLHTKSWLEIFQTRGDLAPHFRVPHTTAKFPYDFLCKKSPKGRQLRKFAKFRKRTGVPTMGGAIRGTQGAWCAVLLGTDGVC